MVDASDKQPKQGAVTGGWICLLIGSGLMLWSMFSFFIYLPVFLAAFVLGIVAIIQHRIAHGVTILLLSIIWPIMLGFAINDYSKYKRSVEQQAQYNYNEVPDKSERIPVRETDNHPPPSMKHPEFPTQLPQESSTTISPDINTLETLTAPAPLVDKTSKASLINTENIAEQQLLNGEYVINNEPVKLTNGKYNNKKFDYVSLEEFALGDIDKNGMNDAVVILCYSGGGTGIFYELFPIINREGKIHRLKSVELGDRIKVNSIVIKNGTIIVDMVTQGPQDGMCCPTLKKIAKYQLIGNRIVER